MKNLDVLNVAATSTTPAIAYDPSEQVLSIKGRCLDVLMKTFWESRHEKIQELAKENKIKQLSFEIEYFNTAAQHAIKVIFMQDLKALPEGTVSVLRNYDADDDDMLIAGETYGEMATRLPHIAKRENVAIAA